MSLPVCLSPPAVPLFPSLGCLAALPGVEAQEGVAGMEPQRDEAKPCSKSAQTCEILQFSTAAWEAKDICSVPWHNKSSPLASHCQAEQHSPFQQCRAVTKHTVLLATPLGSMGSLPTQTCEGRCPTAPPCPCSCSAPTQASTPPKAGSQPCGEASAGPTDFGVPQ